MEKTKRQKYMEIKRSRNQQEFSTFTFEGNTYDCNQISQQRIGLSVQEAMYCMSAGIPFSKDWTLADNTVTALTAQQMIGVALAMSQYTNYAHARSRMLRKQIALAETVENIADISWSDE